MTNAPAATEPPAPAPAKKGPALHVQIIAAMAIGLLLGPLLGKEARVLGEVGKVVIDLIKAAATPLLFFAIINAILKTEVPPGKAWRLVFWAAINACIALAIGLLLSNLF